MKKIKKMIEELIKKCNKLSEENNDVMFIFHKIDKDKIDSYNQNEDVVRNNKINLIIKEDIYYISNIDEFNSMPSRQSIYDTNTKILDRDIRYNYCFNCLKNLNFLTESENNFGREYEQTFYYSNEDYYISITLTPNLFIKVKIQNFNEGTLTQSKFFFNKGKIINEIKILGKSFTRGLVIDTIMEE